MQEHVGPLKSQVHGSPVQEVLGSIFEVLEKRKLAGPDRAPDEITAFLIAVVRDSVDQLSEEKTYEAVVRATLVGAGVTVNVAESFAEMAQRHRGQPESFLKLIEEAQRAFEANRKSSQKRQMSGPAARMSGVKNKREKEALELRLKKHLFDTLVALDEQYPNGVPLEKLVERAANSFPISPREKLKSEVVKALGAMRQTVERVGLQDPAPRYRVREVI